MYVKNRMTANPYTIASTAPVTEAADLMREKDIRRLPVVDDGHLTGILTKGDIQKVSPTKATTLSIYELNYLLSKTTVRDAMTREVITINPDALLEEAAVLMRDNRIGNLAVVENGNLVGIITESDIFDAFIDIFGFRCGGTRLTIDAADVPGALAHIGEIFEQHKANITHIVAYRGASGRSNVVIRTNAYSTEAIEDELQQKGYFVIHVLRSRE